jgi:hypothetical protein
VDDRVWVGIGRQFSPTEPPFEQSHCFPESRRPFMSALSAATVKGFGRLRTKASSAGTRGPHAPVYG